MDPLIIDLVRQYVYMVLLACAVMAAAFFWRRPAERNPVSTGATVAMVLMAAVFMLVVSLVAQAFLAFISTPAGNTTIVARVALPMLAGLWFTHSRLRALWTGAR